MKLARNMVLAVIFLTCALSWTLASPKFEVRTPARRGFEVAKRQSTVAGIGVGKPTKFAFLNAWTTSDGLAAACPDLPDSTTDIFFFTDELLTSVANFYTLTTKEVSVSVVIKDANGNTFFNDGFTAPPPEPDVSLVAFFDLGMAPAGAYKVLVKFKQGSTVIGGSYWFFVSEPPALSTPK